LCSNAEWNEMERGVAAHFPHLVSSWHAANDRGLRRVCVCRRVSRPGQVSVQCEQCHDWFHPSCLGLPATALSAAGVFFVCLACRAIPEEALDTIAGLRLCDCLSYTSVTASGTQLQRTDVPLPQGSRLSDLAVFRLPAGHPAYSAERVSRGVRAKCAIARGASLGYYAGEVVPRASGRGYDFALDGSCDGPCVDAAQQGNALRFLNHSDDCCNCRAVCLGGALIRVVASRDIAAGQELLLHYGAHFWPQLK
jgi:hypothetical protein